MQQGPISCPNGRARRLPSSPVYVHYAAHRTCGVSVDIHFMILSRETQFSKYVYVYMRALGLLFPVILTIFFTLPSPPTRVSATSACGNADFALPLFRREARKLSGSCHRACCCQPRRTAQHVSARCMRKRLADQRGTAGRYLRDCCSHELLSR